MKPTTANETENMRELTADEMTEVHGGTGGAGAGKIQFNEFEIKKTTDKASATFFLN